MSRLQAWIWRDAKQPRVKFRRRLPLLRGWEVEVLYPCGDPGPVLTNLATWPGETPWDRGWLLTLPMVARIIGVGHERKPA